MIIMPTRSKYNILMKRTSDRPRGSHEKIGRAATIILGILYTHTRRFIFVKKPKNRRFKSIEKDKFLSLFFSGSRPPVAWVWEGRSNGHKHL